LKIGGGGGGGAKIGSNEEITKWRKIITKYFQQKKNAFT